MSDTLMKKIEILVKPDGTTSVKVNGVQGASCSDLLKHLESKVGAIDESTRKNTEEYYQNSSDNTLTLGI